MSSDQLVLLQHEIEKTFGRRILSSADCHLLCIDIEQKIQQRISFNTMRRYFNLMKDNHEPSVYTLGILSNYCGFSSFEDFLLFRKSHSINNEKDSDISLLNYLLMLFKNTEVNNTIDVTYFSFVHNTINYLEKHQHMIDAFQRGISKTKNGQKYYFEQFINIDKLNLYYGDGLRYFLNERKDKNSQVFGNSLLCFRKWLTMEEPDQRELDIVLNCHIDNKMEPLVCARYFATKLIYCEYKDLNYESVVSEARLYFMSIMTTKYNYAGYYCFEIILAEALILSGHYEEALFYIQEIIDRIKDAVPSFIELSLLETIMLFKAIIFTNTRRKAKAKEIFENINPNKFYFLSKQYLNILYISISKIINHKIADAEQVSYLISETGFKRLNSFSKSIDSVSSLMG